MSWPQELMQGVVDEREHKLKEAFATIEARLGAKVICSHCGCTIANFGESCDGPDVSELLHTGMACEGIAAIFDVAPAEPELIAWSFVMHRRTLDRVRCEFRNGRLYVSKVDP